LYRYLQAALSIYLLFCCVLNQFEVRKVKKRRRNISPQKIDRHDDNLSNGKFIAKEMLKLIENTFICLFAFSADARLVIPSNTGLLNPQ